MLISELYALDPKAALSYVLAQAENRGQRAFLYSASIGLDRTVYGSYKYFTRESLAGRSYAIEFIDYAVSLLFLDVMYDPRHHKVVPLDDL